MKKVCIVILLLTYLGVSQTMAQKTLAQKANPIFVDVGGERTVKSDVDIDITWITPQNFKTESKGKSLKLKIGINTESEITNIEIYLNDAPLPEVRGFRVVEETGYDQFDQFIEKDLRLKEGDNHIKLVAFNSKGEEITETRVVRVAGETTLVRSDYALLFAINDYESWDDLTNPINDAGTIADELEKNFGFEVEIVTNPTNEEILVKLKEYARNSYLPEDQLFIFFAGHGQFDETFGEGYIVAKNSARNDPAKTTYISHSVLRNVVDNIPSRHTFLAMDVCFGGTFDPKIARSGVRGEDDEYGEISRNQFIKRKLRHKTRKYVTSGGKEYVPDGRPGMHSPFARKFIEALRDYGGADGVLTLPELYGYVEKIDPEPRAGEFGTNEPGSNFLFVAQ